MAPDARDLMYPTGDHGRNTRFVPLSDGAGGTIAPSPIERLRSDLTTLSTDTTASAEARGANDGEPHTPSRKRLPIYHVRSASSRGHETCTH